MKKKLNEDFEYFEAIEGNKHIIFFTAYNDKDFNITTEEGKENINKIKELFDLDSIHYLKQIHSAIIHDSKKNLVMSEGDAIITDCKNLGVGVFTADCVPVIILDSEKDIATAVHSGWKGTFEEITAKTIDKMINEYKASINNIKVFIGPHIKQCCYEVGQDLIQKFNNKFNDSFEIGNNISLEKVIIKQCIDRGVEISNIETLDYCTYCSDTIKFHSYRKNKDKSGRMFSMVFCK
jgi:uncharacterized protein, YfiH family